MCDSDFADTIELPNSPSQADKISQIRPKKAQYKKMTPNKVQPKKSLAKDVQGHDSTPRIEVISLLEDDSLPEEYSPPTPPYSETCDDSIKNNYDPNLDPDLQTKEYIINYLSMKYHEEKSRTEMIAKQLKVSCLEQEKVALENKLAYDKMVKACRVWKGKNDAKIKVIEKRDEVLAERDETILKKEVEISELRNQLRNQSENLAKNQSKNQSKNQAKNQSEKHSENQSNSGKKRKVPLDNCTPVDDENAPYYGGNVEKYEQKYEQKFDQKHEKSSNLERVNSWEAMEPRECSNPYENMSDLQMLREKQVQNKSKKVRFNRPDEPEVKYYEKDHLKVEDRENSETSCSRHRIGTVPKKDKSFKDSLSKAIDHYLEIPEPRKNLDSKCSSLSDKFSKIQKSNEEKEFYSRRNLRKVVIEPKKSSNQALLSTFGKRYSDQTSEPVVEMRGLNHQIQDLHSRVPDLNATNVPIEEMLRQANQVKQQWTDLLNQNFDKIENFDKNHNFDKNQNGDRSLFSQNLTSSNEYSSVKSRLGSPEKIKPRPLKPRNTNVKNLKNQNNKSNKTKKSGKRNWSSLNERYDDSNNYGD